MTPDNVILFYLLIILASLGVVALFTEMRKRRFRPDPSEDRVFKCDKCGFVYTDDPDVDHSRCSQCGQLNEAVEF